MMSKIARLLRVNRLVEAMLDFAYGSGKTE